MHVFHEGFARIVPHALIGITVAVHGGGRLRFRGWSSRHEGTVRAGLSGGHWIRDGVTTLGAVALRVKRRDAHGVLSSHAHIIGSSVL